MRAIGVLIACAGVLCSLASAHALPRRIIILRHAEKIDGAGLCPTGERRAQALLQYLGAGARGAPKSLFGDREQPAAFYAITKHTKETIDPAAATWGLKPIRSKRSEDDGKGAWANEWTQDAAKEVLQNYDGEIVVMAWEHNHIANETLDPDDTLRHLLGIDAYGDKTVSEWSRNWCGTNYDFFWIVDYDPGRPNYDPRSGVPTPVSVTRVLQDFAGDYANLPKNDWGHPEPGDALQGCTATPEPECRTP